MAAEEKTESAPAPAAPASGGSNKTMLMITAVNMVVTLAIMALVFINFKNNRKAPSIEDIAVHEEPKAASGEHGEAKEGEHGGGEGAEKAHKKSSQFGKMVTLEQFTVNLSTPGTVNPKFVRVNISLEVPTDDSEGELTSKMPQVRNTIIDLFNSKRASDLATAEGRDYIKEEIRNAINSFMVTGKVKGVFFTNFAVTG